jgi:4-amino-4-deoxy-L-arabinose transferase-like glycosyltransferase
VCLCLLAGLLGLLVWRYAAHTGALLAYPYDWDEDEGYHVYFAKCLLQGQTIYGDINQVPMLPQTYPPVHAAVLSLFVSGLGATLFAGRLLSMLAVVGIAGVVLAAVRQETGRWSLGALAAALVVGSPYFTVWGPLCRVDSLMVFFVLSGLLLLRQYPRSRAALVAGLLLLLLACYTKQQAVVLLPTGFLHLWRSNRRTALLSLAGFAGAGLAALLGLQLWSGGYFWPNVVTAQTTEFRFELVIARLKDFLPLHGLLVAGATGWLVYQIRARRLNFWSVFALNSAVFVILAGKNGAELNYYLAPVVAVTICSVLALDRVWRSLPAHWAAGTVAEVMILLLVLQGLIFWFYPFRAPTAADVQAGDKLLALVRNCSGDPLIERRAMFSVLAGRKPQADFCLLFFLHEQDLAREEAASSHGSYRPRWEPSALVQAIREKRFPLIIMEPKVVPDEVVSAVSTNYQTLMKQPISIGTWWGANTYQIGVPR